MELLFLHYELHIFQNSRQLADHLIGDELANRKEAHIEHIQFMKERN